MRRILSLFCLLVAVFQASSLGAADNPAPAVEKWSDSRLTATRGLAVWLDAASLAQARKAQGRPALVSGDALDVWPDGSGHKRDVQQKLAKEQPRFEPTGKFQAVRFGGLEQHLRASKLGQTYKASTVFVVTAPFSNPQPFSAWLSLSAAIQSDFVSGLNLDQGMGNPPALQVVNVEGGGNKGMNNLLKTPAPYGSVVRLCVTSTPGKHGTSLWVNGKPQGARDRAADSVIQMDELVIGARRYSLGGMPEIRGFLHGDIAEVLVYDCLLSNDDRLAVEKYLETKYAGIAPLPVPPLESIGKALVRVKSPPPVQVLLPGFTVRQLPLDLPNINNVLYRPDGKLVALGYDGNVWLLSDTDGDGLEDKAALFWENKGQIRAPIGMDLTPPGYEHGNGLFVTSKGKCSLLVDTDGDDRADKENVIATGWKESPHQVDALGVAVDPRDKSVVFGIGTTDFTNAYVVNQSGVAEYDIKGERGAILRVAPDLKSRRVICTGIRFPVGLRFNKAGDLFCTDQEGATWLANGNPFDELLHIQEGRHYGFPPRHPKYLPNVIDEPSTYDFSPQHQSTCGLCFNEPVKTGGPIFGPSAWAGDAFVTGYSRGKLYRTQLAKTPTGYIAKSSLFACLSLLTADCCLTPTGELLIACHSGGPDWGSGPTGKGKLFKIRYADQEQPLPALVWAAGPREVRVEFDRPVDPALLRDALAQTDITAGEFVRAGDRFESLWPGYAVVQAQHRALRDDVKVYSAQLTPDRRTLILATDPLRSAVHYALTLPGMGRPALEAPLPGTLPQHPQIDLDFDLSGVEAKWLRDGKPEWSGWLPTFDFATARRWTASSASHDQLWKAMQEKGELVLTANLNLTDMLRPAVQPGSEINYEWPREEVTLSFSSSLAVRARVVDEGAAPSAPPTADSATSLRIEPQPGKVSPVEVRLADSSRDDALSLTAAYSTAEDSRARPFQPQRALVPWAAVGKGDKKPELVSLPPELQGGSWAQGWKLFHNELQGCAKCHSLQEPGATIGPNLANLIHRDYGSVMRDIVQPSFAINPDYLGSTVVSKDGRLVTGVVRTLEGKLHVGDAMGKTTVIEPADVEEMKPSAVSVMPEGLLKNLSPEQTRDLLTYLLTRGPAMPREKISVSRPAPRSLAEVNAVLAGAPKPPEKWRPLRVVLVAGPKDHGIGEHDYPAWLKAWSELLSIGENVEVASAMNWPPAAEFQKADVMVFYQRGDWNAERAAAIDAFLERGGGLVYVHWAVDGQKDAPGFAKRIALAWGQGAKFRHGPLDLKFNHDPEHPVLRGFTSLKLVDESYWNLQGKLPPDRLLATNLEENQPQPLFWSLEQGKGRIFVSIPGHYSWTFDDPLFRVLLLRGMAWSAHEPVDRFNPLVWPGADIAK